MIRLQSANIQEDKINNEIIVYLKDIAIEDRISMKHLGPIIKKISSQYPSIDNKLISEVYRNYQEALKSN